MDYSSSSTYLAEQSLYVSIFFMCCVTHGHGNNCVLCFWSVKRSLIIHGECYFGFGSWLQHVNMAAHAQGTDLGFKGKSATYCVIILGIAVPVCLVDLPSFSFAYFVLASRRCKRIQNQMWYGNGGRDKVEEITKLGYSGSLGGVLWKRGMHRNKCGFCHIL